MWKKGRGFFVATSIAGLFFPFILLAQPEFPSLEQAYAALARKDYDQAVQHFQAAISIAQARVDIRKDLAYTFLKIGEADLARDQFRQAMALDPSDETVALE